jgi:hypothetical protein
MEQCLIAIAQHEYIVAFFGVLLWQVEQLYTHPENRNYKIFKRNCIRSMIWVGPIIVFDDEILAQYNKFAIVDYDFPPWWMYFILGFGTDIIRTKFTAKVVESPENNSPKEKVKKQKK